MILKNCTCPLQYFLWKILYWKYSRVNGAAGVGCSLKRGASGGVNKNNFIREYIVT